MSAWRPICLLTLVLLLTSGCNVSINSEAIVAANNAIMIDDLTPEISDEVHVANTAPAASNGSKKKWTLVEARESFETQVWEQPPSTEVPDEPPPNVFQLIKYPSPVGDLSAYLTPDPADGRKHPAMIWITGGDCNSIGEVWEPKPRSSDQTAAAYRKAGMVMMFPSLRGGNDNPGVREGLYGEVDDVLAAADYLESQPYVDPKRIYLGGHSTGGTLAMLVTECTDRFRATFAFGPVDDVRGYFFEYYNREHPGEWQIRSPGLWMHCVRTPLFVIEGTEESNYRDLKSMSKKCTNKMIHFLALPVKTHFSCLGPMNELIAERIQADTGELVNIDFKVKKGSPKK